MKYRGSRDGFHYDKWKPKVQGCPNLISIIKSEHNRLFGGFISIPYDFSYNSKN